MVQDIRNDGLVGEQVVLTFISKILKSREIMQLDWVFNLGGKYYLVEVKHQEHFKAPPFDGHGLPPKQVEARLKFYKETGIRPILIVVEKPMKAIYVQYLDVLNSESSNYFDTNGNKKRRVYRLDKFIDYTQQAKLEGII